MAERRGPAFDTFLMRTKDVVWLLGLLWAVFKGIDRFQKLEEVILAQSTQINSILMAQRDLQERLPPTKHKKYPE